MSGQRKWLRKDIKVLWNISCRVICLLLHILRFGLVYEQLVSLWFKFRSTRDAILINRLCTMHFICYCIILLTLLSSRSSLQARGLFPRRPDFVYCGPEYGRVEIQQECYLASTRLPRTGAPVVYFKHEQGVEHPPPRRRLPYSYFGSLGRLTSSLVWRNRRKWWKVAKLPILSPNMRHYKRHRSKWNWRWVLYRDTHRYLRHTYGITSLTRMHCD